MSPSPLLIEVSFPVYLSKPERKFEVLCVCCSVWQKRRLWTRKQEVDSSVGQGALKGAATRCTVNTKHVLNFKRLCFWVLKIAEG